MIAANQRRNVVMVKTMVAAQKKNPCDGGEGDCDNDKQCIGSLVCGKDNCAWGGTDDCCKPKFKRCSGQDDGCCTKGKPCDVGEGDCDNSKQCIGSLVCGYNNCAWGGTDDCCKHMRCKGKDDGCCTKDKPCDEGEGDCDDDTECRGSLVCGKDNCPWGDDDDCCKRK